MQKGIIGQGLPWWSSGQESLLTLQGVQVQFQFGEDPTCLTMWPTKKTKKQRKKRIIEETDVSEDKYCKATKQVNVLNFTMSVKTPSDFPPTGAEGLEKIITTFN